jgi:hypothetical protein
MVLLLSQLFIDVPLSLNSFEAIPLTVDLTTLHHAVCPTDHSDTDMPSFRGRFSQRLETVNELDIPPSSSTLLKIQTDVANMSVFSAQVHPGRALGFLGI